MEIIKIPRSRWKYLPKLLKSKGYKVGAEIGILKGDFTKVLGEVGLKIYGIDPFIQYETYTDYEGKSMDDFYAKAQENIQGLDCTIIRKTSMEAVNDFADESLDFVFIDGNHAYEYVVEDIAKWSKKVRKGGIVAGHDYFTGHGRHKMHVEDAVNGFVKSYKITPLYILTGDKCPSWYYEK